MIDQLIDSSKFVYNHHYPRLFSTSIFKYIIKLLTIVKNASIIVAQILKTIYSIVHFNQLSLKCMEKCILIIKYLMYNNIYKIKPHNITHTGNKQDIRVVWILEPVNHPIPII